MKLKRPPANRQKWPETIGHTSRIRDLEYKVSLREQTQRLCRDAIYGALLAAYASLKLEVSPEQNDLLHGVASGAASEIAKALTEED